MSRVLLLLLVLPFAFPLLGDDGSAPDATMSVGTRGSRSTRNSKRRRGPSKLGAVFDVPTRYKVEGEFRLPFGKISEPFEIIFDDKLGGIVSFYGGLDVSITNLQEQRSVHITIENSEKACFTTADRNGPSLSSSSSSSSAGTDSRLSSSSSSSSSSAGTHSRLSSSSPFPSSSLPTSPSSVRTRPTSYSSGEQSFELQSAFPLDLYDYKFVGNVGCPEARKKQCRKFQKDVTIMSRRERYNFYVDFDENPVLFGWVGYDDLFGSHYDEYVLKYGKFIPNYHNPEDFDIPEQCDQKNGEFESNPTFGALSAMKKLLPTKDQLDFHKFLQKKGKSHGSMGEYQTRSATYISNAKFIEGFNEADSTSYSVAPNHLMDLTYNEMRNLRGYFKPSWFQRRHHSQGGNEEMKGSDLYEMHEVTETELPDSFDWRQHGAVTPVKDQGICGSCWTFGATGAIEGQHFMKTGDLVSLSEQFLVDCAWNGNSGCDGGFAEGAFDYVANQSSGIPTESSYGRYMMVNDYCKPNAEWKTGSAVKGYKQIPYGDEEALKHAVATVGPISVAIDASHRALSFYSKGIYYDPACKNSPDELDHAVLLVGYGTEDGEDYWLLKNSWSTLWGDQGFWKMARNRDNHCGVATDATYPIV